MPTYHRKTPEAAFDQLLNRIDPHRETLDIETQRWQRHCGQWLMLCRVQHGLTREQVAKQTGIDNDTLFLLDTGLADEARISAEAQQRFCQLFAHKQLPASELADVLQVALGRVDGPIEQVMERISQAPPPPPSLLATVHNLWFMLHKTVRNLWSRGPKKVKIDISFGGALWSLTFLFLMSVLFAVTATSLGEINPPSLVVISVMTAFTAFFVLRQSHLSISLNGYHHPPADVMATTLTYLTGEPQVASSAPTKPPVIDEGSTQTTRQSKAKRKLLGSRRLRSTLPWFSILGALALLPVGVAQVQLPLVADIARPPVVTDADALKLYQGQEITFWGDSVGRGHTLDAALARQFTQDTGIRVQVKMKPPSATEASDLYLKQLNQNPSESNPSEHGAAGDVYMLDVVSTDVFADYLLNLRPFLTDNAATEPPLKAVGWFEDIGLLYYRADLLRDYGYISPPSTWDELEAMARRIQEGERNKGNPYFYGLSFQGKEYEGLLVNALEWVASSGGGTIIENGQVTINNQHAIQVLERVKGWIGIIAPDDVLTFAEDDSRALFESGNAAFLRSWPYAYTLLNDPATSIVAGKVDVAPLPHADGQQSVGVVGGQQLGVWMHTPHPEAAVAFVKYLTSPEVQKWRAQVGSYVPANTAVQADWQVRQKIPFFDVIAHIKRTYRPSEATGLHYNEASNIVFTNIHQILSGEAETKDGLLQIEQQLTMLLARAQ